MIIISGVSVGDYTYLYNLLKDYPSMTKYFNVCREKGFKIIIHDDKKIEASPLKGMIGTKVDHVYPMWFIISFILGAYFLYLTTLANELVFFLYFIYMLKIRSLLVSQYNSKLEKESLRIDLALELVYGNLLRVELEHFTRNINTQRIQS